MGKDSDFYQNRLKEKKTAERGCLSKARSTLFVKVGLLPKIQVLAYKMQKL
jgi:hypothetical protein